MKARWLLAAALMAPQFAAAQMATADRVRLPGWWPTKGDPARGDYAGAEACARCHVAHASTQRETPMAGTLARAEDSGILRAHERLQFRSGRIEYQIARKGRESLYAAGDGARSLQATLAWAFGFGKVGQTYLFQKDGAFHESRVSFFDALGRLDFTPARALASPRNLEEALGRRVGDAEVLRCFGCHTTAATTEGVFDPQRMTPGVTCEACHGPGRRHAETLARAAILNPGKLGPADSVDFCGACHATFWDVKLAGEKGVAALRSQPHRLQSSRCWSEDARITCVACHDPHKTLVRDPAAYDARCLACHVQLGSKPTRDHPTANCATCHMPKYEVKEMHFRFTDHWIRVVGARP